MADEPPDPTVPSGTLLDSVRLVARVAREAFWEWDLRTNRAEGTEGVQSLFGYSEDEVGHDPDWWYDHIHPDDRERVRRSLDDAIASGAQAWTNEYRYRRADGSFAFVLDRAYVLRDHDRRPVRVVGSMSDVTEERQAEEQMAFQNSLLEAQNEASPDGILVVGREGRILSFNRRFVEIWELPQEIVDSRSDEAALRAVESKLVDPASFRARVAHLYDHPHEESHDEILLKSGRVLERYSRPIKGPGGGVHYGRIWFFRDVTAARRAEEERSRLLASERHSRIEAEQASRIKDEFLATLSHELRTPLNAVTGWTQLMRSGGLGAEDSARALETIDRNVKALARLISDILDVSRIVSGKLAVVRAPLDLGPVATEALEALRPLAESKPVALDLQLPGEPVVVEGDAQRLEQVLWNLLSNAVKFTPEGGRIALRVERRATEAVVTVTDTGAGIGPEFLPHVFERFRQADSSTTRRHGGLGLGLAIVRHLVEQHGGAVEASSAGAGRGATFEVRLPLATARPLPDTAHPARPHTPGGEEPLRGLKVLVVDDEADCLDLVRFTLSRQGADVITARTAREALDALDREHPTILVCDLGMPGMDGYGLIREVRQRPKERGGDIPAVALTAFARPEERRQALRCGFEVHVSKPVMPAQLTAVVVDLATRRLH